MGERILKFLNDSFVNGKQFAYHVNGDSLGGRPEDIPLPTDKTIYNAVNNIQE